MTPLASIGVAVRTCADNPWLDRLLASLERHPPGLPNVEVLVEEGARLTKVEKLNRLLRAAPGRYVAILEDDTEVLHPGWLMNLIAGAQAARAALAGPLEATAGPTEAEATAVLKNTVTELSNLAGFCLLVDRDAGLFFDVRCQVISDLYLSLLARARGHRLAQVGAAILRHTKMPWAPDGTPPWDQSDRSRFGEGDAYYAQARHQAQRQRDAWFLIAEFGDLARATLPKELLAVVEPEAVDDWLASQPGCWRCRKQLPYGEEWVMTRNGPECFACKYGKDAVGMLSISDETAKALAEGNE